MAELLYVLATLWVGLAVCLVVTDAIGSDLNPPYWEYALWPVVIVRGWWREQCGRG